MAIGWMTSIPTHWMAAWAQSPPTLQGVAGEGCFWMTFATETAGTYTVERSTDLVAWEPLVANLPGDGGLCRLVDPEPVAGHAAHFYRVKLSAGPGPTEPAGNPNPRQWGWISPGSFMIGSANGAVGADPDEGPPTLMVLSQGFWISRCEVTQRDYFALTGRNPSWFTNAVEQPVENVTWEEATNYCALLTARETSAGRLPAGYFFRLPTETEWEYACRAGTVTTQPYGEDPTGSQLGWFAWNLDNSGTTNALESFTFELNGQYYTTHPVGQLQPNRWGLYDLQGNVWEWCQDWYQSSYPNGSVTNYAGPASGTTRVIRGGSWNAGSVSCRPANRSAAFPAARSSGVGFRPVLAPRSQP